MTFRDRLSGVPPMFVGGIIGGGIAGAIGGLVGLVIGLRTYAPTAWFAFFEIGVPAFAAGALIGSASAAVWSVFAAQRRSEAGEL